MNSNLASVGSGDCSRCDEAPQRTLLLVVDPRSIEARAVAIRTDLQALTPAVRGAKTPRWCRSGETHHRVRAPERQHEPPGGPEFESLHSGWDRLAMGRRHAVRRRCRERLECAKSGHSPTAWRTGQLVPKHAFVSRTQYGRSAPESCRRCYEQNNPPRSERRTYQVDRRRTFQFARVPTALAPVPFKKHVPCLDHRGRTTVKGRRGSPVGYEARRDRRSARSVGNAI
jgi:hypothetical protein